MKRRSLSLVIFLYLFVQWQGGEVGKSVKGALTEGRTVDVLYFSLSNFKPLAMLCVCTSSDENGSW